MIREHAHDFKRKLVDLYQASSLKGNTNTMISFSSLLKPRTNAHTVCSSRPTLNIFDNFMKGSLSRLNETNNITSKHFRVNLTMLYQMSYPILLGKLVSEYTIIINGILTTASQSGGWVPETSRSCLLAASS